MFCTTCETPCTTIEELEHDDDGKVVDGAIVSDCCRAPVEESFEDICAKEYERVRRRL